MEIGAPLGQGDPFNLFSSLSAVCLGLRARLWRADFCHAKWGSLLLSLSLAGQPVHSDDGLSSECHLVLPPSSPATRRPWARSPPRPASCKSRLAAARAATCSPRRGSRSGRDNKIDCPRRSAALRARPPALNALLPAPVCLWPASLAKQPRKPARRSSGTRAESAASRRPASQPVGRLQPSSSGLEQRRPLWRRRRRCRLDGARKRWSRDKSWAKQTHITRNKQWAASAARRRANLRRPSADSPRPSPRPGAPAKPQKGATL